jgi:hypothetical protein
VKHTNYKPLLITLIIIIWLSHLIQIFVPETGFDALWYHLPIIKEIIANNGLVYIPSLYQSTNPLFSDLSFALGYLVMGDLGTKIVAYIFFLSLMLISYKLSRKFLNSSWSLLLLVFISTFQVITWQSSSFYVDIAKAFFELTSLYFLYNYLFKKNFKEKKILIKSGLLFGASLASKLFSLFLLPVYLLLILIFSKTNKIKNTLLFLFSSIILPLPFYIFSFINTGHPFYSLTIHTNKLEEISGNSSIFSHLLERTINLPYSFFELFIAQDYVSFIFIIFLPIIIFSYKKIFKKEIFFIFIFSLSQYLLWWYLPPLSSRYAISGFIMLTIFYFKILNDFIKEKKGYFLPIIITIFLSTLINFAPRLIVNLRSLKYISGKQTKEEYLQQFMNSDTQKNIKEWHFNTTLYQFQ